MLYIVEKLAKKMEEIEFKRNEENEESINCEFELANSEWKISTEEESGYILYNFQVKITLTNKSKEAK